MHGGRLQGVAHVRGLDAPEDDLVNLLDVLDGDDGLLLAGVGDLRNGRNGPLREVLLRRLLHAAVVAVADGVDPGVALLIRGPRLALASLHGQGRVHQDPTSASRTELAQRLFGHEVVRRLDADADVLLVCTARQTDAAIEVRVLRVVLQVVILLDAMPPHVLRAVGRSISRQRPQALRKSVDDGQLQVWEEVLQLSDPLHADEAGAHDQDRGTLRVEHLDGGVLLEDVAAAAFQKTLVQMRPRALRPRTLVDRREPQ
mmetsp:Transcript_97288/g.274259  ORF Transcript_97288/g.274259 Transcript_97288/m.274259 type:complete len:258 (+) Transcript_97288:223-996(+)